MRPTAIIILFLCSLSGFAQFYVTDGTLFSLQTSETILSSQETLHQINASVLGNGAVILNSTSKQQLTSTQAILELPTLHIKNADLVQLQTDLHIQNQLHIDRGLLTLSNLLKLPDPSALRLGAQAFLYLMPQGQLLYDTQLVNAAPFAYALAQNVLVSLLPISPQTPDSRELNVVQCSCFVRYAPKDYEAYFYIFKPPPKDV